MAMVTLFAIGSILLGFWTFLFQQRRWEVFKADWEKMDHVLSDTFVKKRILVFQFRQFRRRSGISALLILIGVLFPISWYLLYKSPRLGLFLLLLVMLLLTVVVALAIVDAISTYLYFSRLQRVLQVEQAKWKYHEKCLREKLEAELQGKEAEPQSEETELQGEETELQGKEAEQQGKNAGLQGKETGQQGKDAELTGEEQP